MTPTDPLTSLPHGSAFRFIETITRLEPGVNAVATYLVRGDEFFLPAHFPGNPILPGVVMIEAVAQLGGIIVQSDPERPPLRKLLLAAVQNARINGSAGPGETIEIHARLSGRMGGLAMVEGEVLAGDKKILTARVTLGGEEAGE
ncbi:MAG: 3-hydroxyacyl-ACP dehydratase FabZ family protein [Verrucomicrobiales bacterium]